MTQVHHYMYLQGLWCGVPYHVTGRHVWSFGQCTHKPMTEEEVQQKNWITPGLDAHAALTDIILDKRWAKDVPEFLNFRQVPKRLCGLITQNTHIVYFLISKLKPWACIIISGQSFIGQLRTWRDFTTTCWCIWANATPLTSPSYEARTLLAALDYNMHNHRPPLLNNKGQKM